MSYHLDVPMNRGYMKCNHMVIWNAITWLYGMLSRGYMECYHVVIWNVITWLYGMSSRGYMECNHMVIWTISTVITYIFIWSRPLTIALSSIF